MTRPSATRTVLVLGAVIASAACGAPALTAPESVVVVPPQVIVPAPVVLLSTPRILAFGDSLTEGADGDTPFGPIDPTTPGLPQSYPYKLQALLAARYTSQTISVFSAGKGGATAAGPDGVPRLSGLLTQLKPDVVILLYGVNDLNAGTPIPDVAASMTQLISEVRGRGAYPLLSSVPRQVPGAQRAFSPTLIQPYNAALQTVSINTGALFADIYPLISESMIARDGLHLTESANATLAAAYFAVLKARFEYTSPASHAR